MFLTLGVTLMIHQSIKHQSSRIYFKLMVGFIFSLISACYASFYQGTYDFSAKDILGTQKGSFTLPSTLSTSDMQSWLNGWLATQGAPISYLPSCASWTPSFNPANTSYSTSVGQFTVNLTFSPLFLFPHLLSG